MTEVFRASKGYRIAYENANASTAGPALRVTTPTTPTTFGFTDRLAPGQVNALREFFQHERDTQLGRWRWPENPDYVVYPVGGHSDSVRVVLETNGAHFNFFRPAMPYRSDDSGFAFNAAHAYFDAHPERKPWENAKEDEIWALKIDTYGGEILGRVAAGRFVMVDPDQPPGLLDVTAPAIKSARRIWPEEDQ